MANAVMTHLGAFLAVTGVVAVLLGGLARAAKSYNETGRQILRGLRRVLDGEVQAYLIDYGGRRGLGFNHASRKVAVTWQAGEWCLIYRIDELLGMELIVDDWATGWAFAKREFSPADARAGAKQRVTLRLVFEDPQYADFGLELWSAELAGKSTAPNAREAIAMGNRWLADTHQLLNRSPIRSAHRPDLKVASLEMPAFRRMADS